MAFIRESTSVALSLKRATTAPRAPRGAAASRSDSDSDNDRDRDSRAKVRGDESDRAELADRALRRLEIRDAKDSVILSLEAA